MIRPFQFGDIFLIQRLGRQATKLNTVQSLIQPQSTLWASLTTLIPWNNGKLSTYIMRRRDHGLMGAGLLMAQKRPGRPEVDIIALAPALDTAHGHPAIWEKLLAAYIQEATRQQINRVYVDVPDQPLLVSTFSHVGFKLYTRQTVWRLPPHGIDTVAGGANELEHASDMAIRRRESSDEWGLLRLYSKTIPAAVQVAEGIQTEKGLKPPILDSGYHGESRHYVLVERGEIAGALQIVRGPRGYWMQLWADMLRPDATIPHRLVRFGLEVIQRAPGVRLPVYVGVNDYHGGLGSVLAEFGFVPFTDRARMVRQVVQWVREFAPAAMEPVPAGVVTPFTMLPRIAGGRTNVTNVLGELSQAAMAAAGRDRTWLPELNLPSSRSHLLFRIPFRLLSGFIFRRGFRADQQAKEVKYACGNHRTADAATDDVTDNDVAENPRISVSCEPRGSGFELSSTGFGKQLARAITRTEETVGRRRARPAERPRRENRAAAVGA